jgi:FkbM family methyltransferase
MKNWINVLGFRITLILLIGKVLVRLLDSLKYHTRYSPLKNEISGLLERGFKARVVRGLICTSLDEGNQKYLLRPHTSDKLVFYQVLVDKEYSPLMDLIKLHAPNTKIKAIIDAGSNIGLTSLYFKQHYPEARICSIEPDPDNYIHLVKNLNTNKLSKSIVGIHKALWENNTDKLSISSDFRDGQYWAKSVLKPANAEQNIVGTITLADLINDHFANGPIDILKMDVEGSEKVLFMNNHFIETLAEKVKFLALEIHDELNCRDHISRVLNDNKFSIETIGETTFGINKSLTS